eukprot:1283155-Rhodomonas_salina.1
MSGLCSPLVSVVDSGSAHLWLDAGEHRCAERLGGLSEGLAEEGGGQRLQHLRAAQTHASALGVSLCARKAHAVANIVLCDAG